MAFYFVSTFATAQTPTKQRPYGYRGLPALAFALHGWQRTQRPATQESGFNPLNTVLYSREIYKQTMGDGLTVHSAKNADALEEIENLTTEIMEILNNES
jgi:hypothetical protein